LILKINDIHGLSPTEWSWAICSSQHLPKGESLSADERARVLPRDGTLKPRVSNIGGKNV
jgi:hypothetical protein